MVVYGRVKAVGQKHHRAASVFSLEAVGVQLCLLSAFSNVHARALGLDDGKRTLHVVIQHIVYVALAGRRGHAVCFHFVYPVFALFPSRVRQHLVDIQFSRFGLGFGKGLGHIGLFLENALLRKLFAKVFVFLHQLFKRNIVYRFLRRFFLLCQKRGIKAARGIQFVAVAVRHKIQKNEKVFKAKLRLFLRDGDRRVRRVVAL